MCHTTVSLESEGTLTTTATLLRVKNFHPYVSRIGQVHENLDRLSVAGSNHLKLNDKSRADVRRLNAPGGRLNLVAVKIRHREISLSSVVAES
jgi:hypothetical protein